MNDEYYSGLRDEAIPEEVRTQVIAPCLSFVPSERPSAGRILNLLLVLHNR